MCTHARACVCIPSWLPVMPGCLPSDNPTGVRSAPHPSWGHIGADPHMTPKVQSLPLECVWTCNLLLTKKIWQK